jgi:hypothetical protein
MRGQTEEVLVLLDDLDPRQPLSALVLHDAAVRTMQLLR